MNEQHSPITTETPHKRWEVVQPIPKKTPVPISKMKKEYRFPSLFDNDIITNETDLKNLKLKQNPMASTDLCGIAIVCTAICSFLFVTTIILVISSRFIQKNQLRRKFIESNSIITQSKMTIGESKCVNNHRKVDLSSYIIENDENKQSQYTKPSCTIVKNVEAEIP